jgi:integrase
MAKVLTDLGVRNMKPGAGRREIPDGGQRGLYLLVQASGAKSWAVRYRFNGRARKYTLGAGITLAAARKLAADAMFKIAQGVDPIRDKADEKERKVLADESTVQAICERYMQIAGRDLRSKDARASFLRRLVYPRIGYLPIGDVGRDRLTTMLDKVAKENGEVAADMVLAILRKIFNWHEVRTSRFKSPIVRGMARTKPAERARHRTLTDDEIRQVWQACADPRLAVYGPCIRFLLLTGARRNEASEIRRSEIGTVREDGTDHIVWKLPGHRSKSKKEVARPLSKAALAIIEDMPIVGDSDFIFTLSGNAGIGLNNAPRKRLLDEISGATGWRTHDLRRTARTLLARARVPFDTAERCLGHSRGLLVETYDQHSHFSAMGEAFDKLAAEIDRIVRGDEGAKIIRPAFGG